MTSFLRPSTARVVGLGPARQLRVAAVAALVAGAAGCGGGTEPGSTRVRIRNASTVAFTDVVVEFPGGEVATAAALPAGAVTGYRAVREAYKYAYVTATVRGQRLVIQPIDYVGETPLGAGRFTYELTVDASGRALDVATRRDGQP